MLHKNKQKCTQIVLLKFSKQIIFVPFLLNVSQEIVEICMADFFGETKTLAFHFERRKAEAPFPTTPAVSDHRYFFFDVPFLIVFYCILSSILFLNCRVLL